MPHISLAAEKLWSIWGWPISNSLLTTWLVMGILFGLSWMASHNISRIPGNIQSMAEIIVGGLYDFFKNVLGDHIRVVFPVIATIFLFVIVANWVGLLPGVGTIGFKESQISAEETLKNSDDEETRINADETPIHAEVVKKEEKHGVESKFIPLLRGPTADLNTTLAIALTAVLAIQYFGFVALGWHYTSRYLNFTNPIAFFLGILEIVSELSKVISFAFRLFGNIFAGEVLLAVMAFLMPFIVPLPFLMLELFVGFIQALVFSMLTAVFVNVAVSHGEGEGHH